MFINSCNSLIFLSLIDVCSSVRFCTFAFTAVIALDVENKLFILSPVNCVIYEYAIVPADAIDGLAVRENKDIPIIPLAISSALNLPCNNFRTGGPYTDLEFSGMVSISVLIIFESKPDDFFSLFSDAFCNIFFTFFESNILFFISISILFNFVDMVLNMKKSLSSVCLAISSAFSACALAIASCLSALYFAMSSSLFFVSSAMLRSLCSVSFAIFFLCSFACSDVFFILSICFLCIFLIIPMLIVCCAFISFISFLCCSLSSSLSFLFCSMFFFSISLRSVDASFNSFVNFSVFLFSSFLNLSILFRCDFVIFSNCSLCSDVILSFCFSNSSVNSAV